MGLKINCWICNWRISSTNMLIFLQMTDNSSPLLSWITPNRHLLTNTEYLASSTKDLHSLGEERRPSWLHCISHPNGLPSIHSFVTTRQAHSEVKFVSCGQLLTHGASRPSRNRPAPACLPSRAVRPQRPETRPGAVVPNLSSAAALQPRKHKFNRENRFLLNLFK